MNWVHNASTDIKSTPFDNQHWSYITLHNSRMSYTRIMKFKKIQVLDVFFDKFLFLYDKGFE